MLKMSRQHYTDRGLKAGDFNGLTEDTVKNSGVIEKRLF